MQAFLQRHQEVPAPDALKDSIRCFWYDRREAGGQSVDFEVIPDGYAEIVFPFGQVSRWLDSGERESLPSPFLLGLLSEPVRFHFTGTLEIIGIRCFPWTVFDLLELVPDGAPSDGSPSDGSPPDGDPFQHIAHPVAGLQSELCKLLEANKIDDALFLISTYFLDQPFPAAAGERLSKAGKAMRVARGTISVSEVAAAAHTTVRTLERNFRQSSGHTVKDVSGLMRFEQVRNHLWSYPETRLAALAHDLGYADQAHLSREFKRYSGITPAAFARKAKKEQAAGFVVFVQA